MSLELLNELRQERRRVSRTHGRYYSLAEVFGLLARTGPRRDDFEMQTECYPEQPPQPKTHC